MNVIFVVYEDIAVDDEWVVKGDLQVAWEGLMDAGRLGGEGRRRGGEVF